jgi:hypothetical protein
MNFEPKPSGEKITFVGTMGRSRGQAAFLTFITFLSMASLAIVLTISNPLVAVNEFSPWYALTLLSPLAGVYYWTNAVKEITVEMKLEESEDGKTLEITTVGQKEELERFVQVRVWEKSLIEVSERVQYPFPFSLGPSVLCH